MHNVDFDKFRLENKKDFKGNMKIIKKECVKLETTSSHGGSGTRKLYLQPNEVENVEGMTYGKLPVGNTFAWHNHKDVNEIMFVISGEGKIKDEDGEYNYALGDVFVFPKGVFHEITAKGNQISKFVFIRVFE